MEENNETTKTNFKRTWTDKKNVIIIILIILLFILGISFFRSTVNQTQISDLQSQIQNLTASNNELSSQIEENKTKIAELENNNSLLQNEKNTLTVEKSTLETELQQLKNDNATLNSQISSLKKSSSTSQKVSSSIVGIWNTTITTTEFFPETHTDKEVSYTTTYEFKNNGDFYVNGNKVGTYKDNSIFFKDSNDPNYRTASYKLENSILYVNLYQSNTDICVSTDYYKCNKN